ncbi:MAG: alpha-N-arabinofuranosidase, partial [Vallitaleaceae bacterium]|nr:alpha-N-arabinofuranosidase [Vallitaleaceae bacterium]
MTKYIINVDRKKAQIDKNIYGNFSEHLGRCIYEGLYVGENSPIPNKNGMRSDVVEALRHMKLPVLRWPGGCFADEYHWKDGIGEKNTRKKMINTHWGGVVEDNSFGTHEFFELCEQIGCEPYVNGNVGSGTVQEMSEWVEYMTFNGLSPMAKLREENGQKEPWKLKYFGVGNENWGCGGNMRPEYYADLYRRYQTYVRNYGENKIYRIACGPNSDDYQWTKVLMENAGRFMDGLTLHYYTILNNWTEKGSATQMTEEEYYKVIHKTLYMEELIKKHSDIMDVYDPDKRISLIVDEWGTWYDVEPGTNPGFLYQQNTMRDAMVAGINLNLFNKNADRIRMANIAQLVNVLQAVILTEGEKMLLTPTYHVFEMYKDHQEAYLLDSHLEVGKIEVESFSVPNLYESASLSEEGKVVITLCNIDAKKESKIETKLRAARVIGISGEMLHEKYDAYNTFEEMDRVKKEVFTAFERTEDGFVATLPP